MSNIVYEVLVDSVDDNGCSFIETTLYYKKEDAMAHMRAVIDDFEKDCLSSYDPEDYVIEDDGEFYSWYEDGYYSVNHFDVSVKQKEVREYV